jgi:hypothetical protein
MSREFGEWMGGYFHAKIQYAADDCREGRDRLTVLWGEVLELFYPVAYDIASSEASDCGPERTLRTTLEALPELRAKLYEIEAFARQFDGLEGNELRYALDEHMVERGDGEDL